MSDHRTRTLTTLAIPLLVVAVGACTSPGGASPASSVGPSTAPSAGPSATPLATIEHPTGATDVVLRYEEGGGFVMPGFLASQIPHFTLYGDGTVVFRDPSEEAPPAQGSVFINHPAKTARLTEDQVQELLAFALGDGGLAAARAEYRNDMIADASTAIFTIDAGGLQKAVSVYALGLEGGEIPDAPARAAFQRLAKRLVTLDEGGIVAAEPYVPEAYRAVLFEAPGAVAPDLRAWPWPDLTPADFAPSADPDGLQFPHRTMTPAELDLVDVTDYAGGFQNVTMTGPDGKTYTLSARPLLPDESE